VSIVLLLLAAYIVVMNWGCVIASGRNKRKGIDKRHSTVPLISLILAGFAFPLYPFAPKGWIGIIPAVDIGNWILLIGLPWAIAHGAFKKDSPNKSNGDNVQ
jgi:hypothetical protein